MVNRSSREEPRERIEAAGRGQAVWHPEAEVREAYRGIKASKGAPGVDGVRIGQFEQDLKGSLYKLRNRMSSGSYFPPAVRGVEIPEADGRAPRMNSIMERWIGSCRHELLDRTLIWNQRHLMTVLREYEDFYNTHRPYSPLNQAAPLRPLSDGVTDLNYFRVRRCDRAGGVIHEYRLVA